MELDPNDVIGDFAERTRKNLATIDALASTHIGKKPEPKVFEATQLVNSVLGLLVFPQQGWFDDLPKTKLADLEKQGWPKMVCTVNTVNCHTLDQLVRFLRNAITHFNVEFLGNGEEITGLKLWNNKDGKKTNPINFEIELSLEQLKGLLIKFVDELIRIQKGKI
jgi:hypothetical protein